MKELRAVPASTDLRSTTALVLRAEHDPIPNIDPAGPHQIYKHPALVLEEREVVLPAPDEVLVQMLYVGICGTDIHSTQSDPSTGYIIGSSPLVIGPSGRVLGHEGVGRIVVVGEGVSHLTPGQLVTFESIIRCYHCDPCRRGDFNQCAHAILLGMECDGLFTTYAQIPAVLAHDVDDFAGSERNVLGAACVEPAACAYVACSLADVGPGDDVLIFGAGPIGLFVAMLARIGFGAGTVHVVEPVEFRRELATRWADRTYDVEEFFAESKASFDVLIEASGAVDNVDRALRMLGPNGRVALLARGGRPLVLGHVDHLITNNISVVGSRGNLGDAFAHVLRLMRLGRLRLDDAVTDVVEGPSELHQRLLDPVSVLHDNCKVLAKLA